jgi:hypothetical protein
VACPTKPRLCVNSSAEATLEVVLRKSGNAAKLNVRLTLTKSLKTEIVRWFLLVYGVVLYQSIALEKLYKSSFEWKLIGRSVQLEMD